MSERVQKSQYNTLLLHKYERARSSNITNHDLLHNIRCD